MEPVEAAKKVVGALNWCPFRLNAEYFLDYYDPGVWKDFLKDYQDE
jgi:hypothetical protein